MKKGQNYYKKYLNRVKTFISSCKNMLTYTITE